MKILQINKFFYRKGGSETCFFNTMRLLESKGHRVIPFSMCHPQNEPSAYAASFVSGVDLREQGSLWGKLRTAARIIYSVEARRKLAQLLDREQVDVAHLHNIHHQMSPSIIIELHRRGIPVVMTLHDYKMACPTYSLLNGDGICERCAGRRYWRTLGATCGESRLERVLLCLEMSLHHKVFNFYGLVDVFISPSSFLQEKLRQMGFKGETQLLPNFIDSKAYAPVYGGDGYRIVYFGRLSREKGVHTLIRAAEGIPGEVCVIGDGPVRAELEATVRANKLSNVQFVGYLSGESLRREVAAALAVVAPSEWYENNPLSVIEAFALGKPVVGSRIGGIPELVRDGETGLTFEPGNTENLRDKLTRLLERPDEAEEMGRRARNLVDRELNPDRHYEGLMAIYERAMGKARKGRR